MKIYLMQDASPTNSIKSNKVKVLKYEGILKNETSVLAPTIDIEENLANICMCNKIYIPTFKREYFITNIESLSAKLTRISGKVDVLKSFKKGILQNEATIKRNQYYFSRYIPDNERIVKNRRIVETKRFPKGFTGESIILSMLTGDDDSSVLDNFFGLNISQGLETGYDFFNKLKGNVYDDSDFQKMLDSVCIDKFTQGRKHVWDNGYKDASTELRNLKASVEQNLNSYDSYDRHLVASCDRFVAMMIKAWYDPTIPWGACPSIYSHCASKPNLYKQIPTGTPTQRGDIFLYQGSEYSHVAIIGSNQHLYQAGLHGKSDPGYLPEKSYKYTTVPSKIGSRKIVAFRCHNTQMWYLRLENHSNFIGNNIEDWLLENCPGYCKLIGLKQGNTLKWRQAFSITARAISEGILAALPDDWKERNEQEQKAFLKTWEEQLSDFAEIAP